MCESKAEQSNAIYKHYIYSQLSWISVQCVTVSQLRTHKHTFVLWLKKFKYQTTTMVWYVDVVVVPARTLIFRLLQGFCWKHFAFLQWVVLKSIFIFTMTVVVVGSSSRFWGKKWRAESSSGGVTKAAERCWRRCEATTELLLLPLPLFRKSDLLLWFNCWISFHLILPNFVLPPQPTRPLKRTCRKWIGPQKRLLLN